MTAPVSNVDQNAVFAGQILVTGGSYVAPVGAATAPVNAEDPLHAAFKTLGYIGPDGVTRSDGTTLKNVMASGGTVVKTHATEQVMTHALRIMQSNYDALVTVFGPDNVTPAPGGGYRVAHNIRQRPRRMFAFDLSEGASYVREFIPNGQVTAVSDVVLGGENELAYDVTVTCYDDADGNKAYTFYKISNSAGGETPEIPATWAEPTEVPTITSQAPNPAVGGETVTITGTGFSKLGTTVLVDAVAPANVVVASATSLSFTMPGGVTGEAGLFISNPIGDSTLFSLMRA